MISEHLVLGDPSNVDSQRGLGVADENLASLRDTQSDRGLVGALIALAAVIAFGSVVGL